VVKFEINNGKAYISIPTTNAEKSVLHQYSGDTANLIDALEQCHGMFGHSIGRSSPAIDVHHALFYNPAMKQFKTKLIEGADIISRWKAPDLPKGAVS